jgi:hypothetical protein
LTSYLDGSLPPTLAAIEASVRKPGMWRVDGVLIRLLIEWQTGGAKATEAADRAVSAALGKFGPSS